METEQQDKRVDDQVAAAELQARGFVCVGVYRGKKERVEIWERKGREATLANARG